MPWSRASSLVWEVALPNKEGPTDDVRAGGQTQGSPADLPASLPSLPASSPSPPPPPLPQTAAVAEERKEGSNERDAGSPRRDKEHITTKTS
jgi:hypothetical protein